MSLKNKVIVITGASTGLGEGMAIWFAAEGASLGLCARRVPLSPVESSVVSSVDVTDLAALELFVTEVGRRLGPIDLWINNAAVLGPVTPQRDLSAEELNDHLAVNVGGVLNGTKAFLDHLDKAGHRGALVNITSGLAQRGAAGLSAYSAAKAGVDRLTEVVAIEEPDLLTTILAVSPGVIETDMQRSLRQQSEEVLHDVERFREYKAEGNMNSPGWVAQHIARWVFDDVALAGQVMRVPPES